MTSVPAALIELGKQSPASRRERMREIADACKAFSLEDVPDYVLDLLAWKTIEDSAIDYEIALTEIAADVFNRARSRADAERAIDRLIAERAEDVYAEGLAEAGDGEVELTDQDRETIREWVLDQQSYSGGLADAMAAVVREPDLDTRRGMERAIFERLKTWVASLRVLGGKAKASALANRMVTWIYGDTDHCRTCERLNGKRHRLSWFTSREYIPQEPGSGSLECGGWRCQCVLVDDDGDQVLP